MVKGSFLKFFSRKPQVNYDFTDEDREYASEVRKMSTEQRKIDRDIKLMEKKMQLELKKAEFDDLKAQLYGDPDADNGDGDDPQNMEQMLLMTVLAPMLQKMQGAAPTPPAEGVPSATVEKVQMSDEDITRMVAYIPRGMKKQLLKEDDATLLKLIHSRIPNLHPDSAARAVALFRGSA